MRCGHTMQSAIHLTAIDAMGTYQKRDAVMSERELGTVKWFNSDRRHGMITRDSGSDLFFPDSSLPAGTKTIEAGQKVSFVYSSGQMGELATKIAIIS
jgi:cold shock protein